MEKKVGFLQNSNAESSTTRLLNLLFGACVIIVWGYLSLKDGKMADLNPMVLGVLGGGQIVNTANKWLEMNGNSEQVKYIKNLVAKVKKKSK